MILSLLLLLPNITLAFSAYSNDELDQLEREFVQQINQSDSVIRNPLAIEYINHLAKRLAQHGDLVQPYFFIVKSKEINAFAGPGGYIGVNSQLILATDNESELAAVMAHEMSHVRQHHLYRMLEHQKQMRVPMLASMLASIALGVINPVLASGALMGSMTGFAQDNINFVRSNEKEADSIGIDMLIKSGLDPRGMAGFFRKMQENMRYYYTDNIPAILRTHPLDEERIAEAENRSLHLAHKSYPDNLNYRLFKELIRVEVANNAKQLMEYYKQCPKSTPNSACQYGYVLTALNMDQNQQAIARLNPLLQQDSNNLFFAIAKANAEEANHQSGEAASQLSELHTNFPDNYAVLMEYGKALIEANQYGKAASVLLKGRRIFKYDLALCNQLAQAQAKSNNKGYAYFTLAECHLLQGERKYALRKLKTAQSMAPKDHILQARVAAKIDEIKAFN
ncbi:MAG: M48 family metalloprotease [Legionellaceae bacterium]|nr:M48 family metalloprotease [Legionellaceae bacterium]